MKPEQQLLSYSEFNLDDQPFLNDKQRIVRESVVKRKNERFKITGSING